MNRARGRVVPFLIDECLSPALLEVAREHGYNAYHVTQRGWAAFTDARSSRTCRIWT